MVTIERLCMGCMNDNGGEEICPICGHKATDRNPDGFLPVKTWIKNRYLVGSILENDGEGVTYIGWDNEQNNILRIREFFPVPLASRGSGGAVVVAEGKEYLYNIALLDFINLYKTLQGVELAAVDPIEEILECNNAAYVFQRFAPGISLREFLLRNGGSLSWGQARPLFMPLISTLIALHSKGVIHGGISPETILVGRDGRLRLTGFASAQLRQSGSSINAQLFPGYAALEQYGVDDGRVICEATDVYGFAATLFRTIMGSTLPEATERLTDDKMNIPAAVAEHLPKALLVTLADALQIRFEDRTKTMDDFKLDLADAADVTSGVAVRGGRSETVKAGGRSGAVKATGKSKKPPMNSNKKYAIVSAAITAGVLLVIGLAVFLATGRLNKEPVTEPPVTDTSSQSSEMPESSLVVQTPESTVKVPDFAGLNMTYEDIQREYPDFIFSVEGKKYSSKAAGMVVGQTVPAGSKVARETSIALTISLGQETVTVPALTNTLKDAATVQLFKNGFLYQNIHFYEIDDDTVDYGCVVKTDPVAGTSVSPDSTITVYISRVKNSDVGVE